MLASGTQSANLWLSNGVELHRESDVSRGAGSIYSKDIAHTELSPRRGQGSAVVLVASSWEATKKQEYSHTLTTLQPQARHPLEPVRVWWSKFPK